MRSTPGDLVRSRGHVTLWRDQPTGLDVLVESFEAIVDSAVVVAKANEYVLLLTPTGIAWISEELLETL